MIDTILQDRLVTKPDNGTTVPDASAPEKGLIMIRIGQTDHPLKMMGNPITRLYPGWRAVGFEPSLLPMPVLTLCDENGTTVSWLFDRALNYRANAFADLTPDERNTVIRGAAPFFKAMADQGIAATQPRLAPGALPFKTFAPALRNAVMEAWLAQQPAPRLLLTALESNEPIRLHDAFTTSLAALTQMVSAARGLIEQDTPIILSPTGRTILRGAPLPPMQTAAATRFIDPELGLVFYLGTVARRDDTETEPVSQAPFLYCPQANIIVSDLPNALAQRVPFLLMACLADDPERFLTVPRDPVVQVDPAQGFTIGTASALAHEAEDASKAATLAHGGHSPSVDNPFAALARDVMASAQIDDAFHGRFAEPRQDDVPAESPGDETSDDKTSETP